MSVIRCFRLANETTLDLDEFGRATVVQKYRVETNSDTDGPYTVAIQSTSALPDPIPHILTQYDLDHGAGEITGTTDYCAWLLKKKVTRAVNEEDGRRYWYVTCTWGPLPIGFAGASGSNPAVLPNLSNPLSDSVVRRSEYEHYRKRAEYDVNGSALVNSAGDPLYADVDDIRPVLVYIKNKATGNEIDELSAIYKNATNSDVFDGHAINTLKIASITKGHLQERRPLGGAPIQFVPMIVRIHKAEKATGSLGTDENWSLKLPDRGPQCLEQSGTFYVKNLPKVIHDLGVTGTAWYGEYLDTTNLNSDGTKRADNLPPLTKTFTIYPSLPFSGLGLV
jgi:hypothetical protein